MPGYSHYNPSGDNGIPPDHYTCHRCGKKGHYKNRCPTNDDPNYDESKSTGITTLNKITICTLGPEKFK